MRNHEPITFEEFNGLWKRGDADSVPADHFSDCSNIQFIQSGFRTRDGLDTYSNIQNVVRAYTYVQQTGESLLVLDTNGKIYHTASPTPSTPILTIAGMTDFAYVSISGRAYISPHNGVTGLASEYLYVYKGDGTAARKAGGIAPSITGKVQFQAFNNLNDGLVEAGIHVFAVAYTVATPGTSILGTEVFPLVNAPGGKQVTLNNIPIGPAGTTSRIIVATKAIDPKNYTSVQTALTVYLLDTIADNTTTSKDYSFTDASLVTDKSALLTAGTGTPPAAPVDNALHAKNTATDGYCEVGLHVFAIVYETDTGFLTAPGPESFAVMTLVNGLKKVTVNTIPVSGSGTVVARRVIATKSLANYDGNQRGYQFFLVPNGRIADNSTTTITFSFFDADLLDDASHLFDIYTNPPAGVFLTTYHGRLVLGGESANISVARLSEPGEPEAISQVDGLIIIPLDGNPITNAQEFRDVLYVFKKTRTFGYTDNNDVPSSWLFTVIDQGIGASVHGIAFVLDSGGVNIDFLVIVDYSGIMLFNGSYIRPELSWKIRDLWFDLQRNAFINIQILNDSLSQMIYVVLPDKIILIGDYSNISASEGLAGLNYRTIRWAIWTFPIEIKTITLINTNQLIIGA